MRKAVLANCMVILLLLAMGVCKAGEITLLDAVDYIDLSAYVKNNVLKLSVLYKNKGSDRLVFWRNGSVDYECYVYKNDGNILSPIKGEEITSKSGTLRRFSQDIYIDIPEEYLGRDKRAIIECSFDIGGSTIKAVQEVGFYNL